MTNDSFAALGYQNIAQVEEIYEQYLKDPQSVDPSWHKMFADLERNSQPATPQTSLEIAPPTPTGWEHNVLYYPKLEFSAPADLRIYSLIEAYRTYGHLQAKVNPIATHSIEEPHELKLETLGFSKQDLSAHFPTCGLLPQASAPLLEIVNVLKTIYCDLIGVEYMALQNPELEAWLQKKIEPNRFKIKLSIDEKQMILQELNKSELFESFLHTKYVGQKRFSLEGGETLIPMLQVIIDKGSELGMNQMVIGMAHRGRLNVLSNILNKSYTDIFSEFEEGYIPDSFEGSGDVKYHKGFSSQVTTSKGNPVSIILSPNPSHLEAVDPVVEGIVKAKQIQGHDEFQKQSLPVLIHGDAAIAGQGVVYETLQMYALKGYSTGGTIHIIINNQIGFTTLPRDARSTPYCTDIARAFSAPVFHVNGEDPEGCVYATLLAIELRQKFHCDVFIDLNCYRKYGHNEGDEPAFTQPLEYQIIRKKKPIREIYRDHLIQQGVLERYMAEALEVEFKKALQQAQKMTKLPVREETTRNGNGNHYEKPDLFAPIETSISKDRISEIEKRIYYLPDNFTVHPKLVSLIQERRDMLRGGDQPKPLDWGTAELLTYASLLWEGVPIRISGQDTGRGTFSHRHALLMDQKEEWALFPLSNMKEGQGRFDVINSPLSEYSVLGFEYGYSIGNPETLVIWEAQFGDFCNGAQVIIDQFISTAEMKWGQKFGLVLFLPHGYEGQGPEHSSGRMERFLTLCGDNNLQVVYPTKPAQLFHLLRRQMLRSFQKPLVVFTPKGLLRHPACVSDLDEFIHGSFQEIIDDPQADGDAKKLVFCTGRIYYDLIAEREKNRIKDFAFIRIEQLYPMNKQRLKEIFEEYEGAREVIWVQEEPSNMGAWTFIRPFLEEFSKMKITYIGRERSASPAVGSYALHKKQHAEIIKALFEDQLTAFMNVESQYKA